MAELPSIPQRPPGVLYPGLHPLYYPPTPILEVYKALSIHNTPAICLKWNMTRQPTTTISGYELYTYEHNQWPYNPRLWTQYWGDVLHVDYSGVYIPTVLFNRRRRYFFTMRLVNDMNIYGPFCEPVSIVV